MSDPADRLNKALEGRYRVERELGAGGMATVYLAEDLRHERKVALKVLKPELAAAVGADRFLAEIKTTAGLQHPHILPLHDSGETDGFLFYVMPYVEGESLRHRLDREGQLPVDEALRIATAVAHALQAAHDKGVIHRDIKPANILLQDGEPMVADFGIALALDAVGGARLTETGLSVGTPHYMSPEQATGDRNVGRATDVYALGCVLYEMLVGEPPYTGSNVQIVLGKMLTGEFVPPAKTRPSVPLNVDAAIRKALEKLPADRFVEAQSFASALTEPGFRHGDPVGTDGGDARLWKRVSLAMAGLAALATVAAVVALQRSDARSMSLARFDVTPMGAGRLVAVSSRKERAIFGGVSFAISEDGSRIVYVGEGPNGTRLWRRDLDDLEPRPIPGTDGATSPALSPDGQSVAFELDGGIRTVSLEDGRQFTVAARGTVPAWGPEGTVVFAHQPTETSEGGSLPRPVLYRVPATGGEPTAWTSLADAGQWFPSALPDDRGLLMTLWTGDLTQSRIAVVGPEGGEVRTILRGQMARYSASGHVVYATLQGTLMAAPFDLGRLEVTGPSVGILEGVDVHPSSGAAQFAVSRTGTLLYRTGASVSLHLVWTERSGAVSPIDSDWTGQIQSPALSPDGTRVAVVVWGTDSRDIWVMDLARGSSLRLTFEGRNNEAPTWTPDGESVTFTSDRSGEYAAWTRRADGTGEAKLEVEDTRGVREARWSPDGQWLLYRTTAMGGASEGSEILAIRPGLDSLPASLVSTGLNEVQPAVSPDGRWLAYAAYPELYVVPFPNVNEGRWLVSSGGAEPAWSRSGRELFYVNGQGEFVAVAVETTPTFSVGRSTVLFSAAEFRSVPGQISYAVAPDDQRFLMIRETVEDPGGRLILVQNWVEELEPLVPK